MAKVCYVATSEVGDNDKCKECGGMQVDFWESPDGKCEDKSYPVKMVIKGRRLLTYRIDGVDKKNPSIVTQEDLSHVKPVGGVEYYPIPTPDGFNSICVFYNSEGGPNIKVTAFLDGANIHPEASEGADGSGPSCPLASVTLKEKPYDLSHFKWHDDAIVRYSPTDVHGCWGTMPGDNPGMMALEAKKILRGYAFDRWEFNVLSPTQEPPKFQPKSEGLTYNFDANIFAGLIAHYVPLKLLGTVDETTIPGPVPPCDPTLFVLVKTDERIGVIYQLASLLEGRVLPILYAPSERSHGASLQARVSRELREEIMRAAQEVPGAHERLGELLRKVAPTSRS